jgi:glycosyltransferase involved in cell wall biosynthesis
MEEKINILQLSPRYPFPMDDGGKIGIANITKELAGFGANISFFTFTDEDLSSESKLQIQPFANLEEYRHSTRNTPGRILGSLFYSEPLYTHKHFSKKIFEFAEKLISDKKINVIHADHTCMAPLALALKDKYGIPVGLRLHNIEWIIWQRYADVLPEFHPKKIYIQSQAKKLRKKEAELLQLVDVAFAITEEDQKRALELHPNLNVKVSTAGVDANDWMPDDSIIRNDNELILATYYPWRHNVDGLKWFIENILTEIYKINPNIRLTLLGKGAPEWLKDYESIGVNLIGYVDRVQSYHNRASIYISPLFVGGGIRIKILEAMAMKLPVISTYIGAEGIRATADNGLIRTDDKNEWINTIIELTGNRTKLNTLGNEARNFVTKNHSWSENIKIMIQEYENLIHN